MLLAPNERCLGLSSIGSVYHASRATLVPFPEHTVAGAKQSVLRRAPEGADPADWRHFVDAVRWKSRAMKVF